LLAVQPACSLAPFPIEAVGLRILVPPMNLAKARTGPLHRLPALAGLRRRASAIVLFALILSGLPVSVSAQVLKPWVPPAADSLVGWATEAKVRFQSNTGDSIGGENFRAYDLVGRMGRRLLRSLGREGMAQASAIRAVLDSLGLETQTLVDPDLPYFALLLVRNPYRRTAKAVGFLYWYRDKDLRMQGAQFHGGFQPVMRVWWTGNKDAPYSWGVVDRNRGDDATVRLTLFRLEPQGLYWNLVQFDDTKIPFGASGSASWVDLNGDRRYELVAWVPAEPDSMFDECSTCPKRINELVFIERPEGFRLLDTRLVPSPYSTFTVFVRLLTENNRAQAAKLVKNPALVQRAVAAGWGSRRGWRTWLIEESEPGAAWPAWLMVRFKGPRGERRYRVDFEVNRGRWVIRDWAERQSPPAGVPPRSGARPAAPGATGR
jgi:hypothetical protein